MKKILPIFIGIIISFTSFTYANQVNPTQDFNTNTALFYDFKQMPSYQLTDKISMRFITTPSFTIIQWTLKQGAKLPPHSHVNEQITRVDSGQLEVDSEGVLYDLHAGEIMVFPSYVKHGFIATQDTVIYEQQTPIRQDFLEPGFIEKLSEYLSRNQ